MNVSFLVFGRSVGYSLGKYGVSTQLSGEVATTTTKPLIPNDCGRLEMKPNPKS
jgi:hypothetical protein